MAWSSITTTEIGLDQPITVQTAQKIKDDLDHLKAAFEQEHGWNDSDATQAKHSKPLGTDLDVNEKQLLKARLENRTAGVTPAAANVGRVYFNTMTKRMHAVVDAATERAIAGFPKRLQFPRLIWKRDATNPTTEGNAGNHFFESFPNASAAILYIQGTVPSDWDGQSDLVFEFVYSMSTSEAAKNVKLDIAADVIAENGTATANGAMSLSQTIAVPTDGNVHKVVSTMKLTAAQAGAAGNLIVLKVTRDSGVANNHGGAFRLSAFDVTYY